MKRTYVSSVRIHAVDHGYVYYSFFSNEEGEEFYNLEKAETLTEYAGIEISKPVNLNMTGYADANYICKVKNVPNLFKNTK